MSLLGLMQLAQLGGAAAAMAPPWDRAVHLKAAEISAVKKIAASRPCAAIALYYVRTMSISAESGRFYFEVVPTFSLVAPLVEGGDRTAAELLAPTQPSLYSSSSYLVEIRWSVHAVGRAARMLDTDAEIVDQLGRPLNPTHVIERPTSLLMTGGTLRLVRAAGGA